MSQQLDKLKNEILDYIFSANEAEMVAKVKHFHNSVLKSRGLSPSPHGGTFSCPWPDLYGKSSTQIRTEMERVVCYLWTTQRRTQHSWGWFEKVASEEDKNLYRCYSAYQALSP